MELADFVEELNGKVSDLAIATLQPITEDNIDDISSGSPIMSLFGILAAEITDGYAALGYPAPAYDTSEGMLGFAKAVGYPYSRTDVPFIIDYLVSELQAVRMALASLHTSKTHTAPVAVTIPQEIVSLCKILSIPSTEEAVRSHPDRALAQVKAKLVKMLERIPKDKLDSTHKLLDGKLATDDVMKMLSEINAILKEDYTLRREMLIKRLDVTVQSFLWSERVEGREGEIMSSIAHRRKTLTVAPASIRPEDAFIAGPDLAALLTQRVTDASTSGLRYSSVKTVTIGAVPDRGGRVGDMKLSARDLMPEWQPRKAEAKHAPKAKPAAGAGRETSDASHDDRARELLAEAAKYEGEARNAAEAYDEVVEDDDAGVTGTKPNNRKGGRGRGRGRGGRR